MHNASLLYKPSATEYTRSTQIRLKGTKYQGPSGVLEPNGLLGTSEVKDNKLNARIQIPLLFNYSTLSTGSFRGKQGEGYVIYLNGLRRRQRFSCLCIFLCTLHLSHTRYRTNSSRLLYRVVHEGQRYRRQSTTQSIAVGALCSSLRNVTPH